MIRRVINLHRSESYLLLNGFEKLVDFVGFATLVSKDHASLLKDVMNGLKTVLVSASTNENEVFGKFHAFELL